MFRAGLCSWGKIILSREQTAANYQERPHRSKITHRTRS